LKTQKNDANTFLREGTMGISTAVADLRNDTMYEALSQTCTENFVPLLQYDEKLRKQKQKAKSDSYDENLIPIYRLIYKAVLAKLDIKLVSSELLDYMRCIAERIFEFRPNDVALVKERLADFIALRIVNPMLIDVAGAIGKKNKLTPEAKQSLQTHGATLGKVIQKAGTKARLEPNQKPFEAEYNQFVERLEKIANHMFNRLYPEGTPVQDLEELEEIPDELQEIEDDDPLFEIVQHNGKEFVIGAITSSNPFLWIDHDAFGERFCISTAKPTVQGKWDQGNQFCALMALQWLEKRPQTLKLGDLGQEDQVEMASRLVDSTMEAQVNLAKAQLKSASTKTLSPSVFSREGALIWMGNDRHAMAAEILGNGMAKFYDPDIGTTQTIATEELKLRTESCNTFVAS
jgi:hypothetical protein